MAVRERSYRRSLAVALGAALALALASAGPAIALTADPGRSSASVQAPGLAPGVSGSAPLYGELASSGAFHLVAPTGSVSTGNALYDAVLHRSLGRTITLVGTSPRVLSSRGTTRTFGVQATVYVAGRAASYPMRILTVRTASGTWLRASCRVGLAAYGIRTLTGGPPGPLRVVINAYFPQSLAVH